MNFVFYVILVATVANYCHSHPCIGSHCSYRPKCSKQSCDSTYSNSCSDSSPPCRAWRTCTAQCCETRSCCENSCCNCPCPEPESTSRPYTTLYPNTSRSPTPLPSSPPPSPRPTTPCSSSFHSSSYNNTNVNDNNNTVIIPTNITIQNEIRSETHITIPVNISINNVNNIHIAASQAGSREREGEKEERKSVIILVNNTKEIINETSIVPVSLPFSQPLPLPISVPYVTSIPYPQFVSQGCCQTVQPCAPYQYCGCQSSSLQCSDQCSHPYIYQPVDICHMGCHKRDRAIGQHCSYGGCYHGYVDCSSCNRDFHQTYGEFQRCSGCFVPMSWGQGETEFMGK